MGVASGFKSVGFTANWPDPASAEIRLLGDGRVQLCTGCADFGQGSTTTVAQIAAETLGLDYDRIELKLLNDLIRALDEHEVVEEEF